MRRSTSALVLLLGMVAASLASAAVAIRAYDFGWHLTTGNWILANGRPPLVDFLTFTAAGQTWVDHEWLFQVILASVVAAGGLSSAWALKLLLVACASVIPAAVLLRRGHPPLAVAVLGSVALAGARFRFFVRPELAGLLLVVVTLLLLMQARTRARYGRNPWPFLAPLPVVLLVWVNLHPSALLGAGLIALSAVMILVEQQDLDRAWPFLGTAVGTLAVLLANPYGTQIFQVPLAIGTALSGEGLRNPEWGPTWQPTFWFFWILSPLLLVLAVVAWRRGVRLSLPMLACGLALVVLGATSLRFLGFFYMSLPVLVLGAVDESVWLDEDQSFFTAERRFTAWIGMAVPLLATVWFLAFPWGGPLGSGLAPGRFPEAMARSLRSLDLEGAIYNPVRFGGYLAWALEPQPVFIDGRNEVHAGLLNEMAGYRLAGDLVGWDRMLAKWDIQAVILSYENALIQVRLQDGSFVQRSPRAVFFRSKKWGLVDWDDTAMLLVRRDILESHPAGLQEDRISRPDDPRGLATDLAEGKLNAEEVLAMALQRQGEHVLSGRARLMERLALEQLSRSATASALDARILAGAAGQKWSTEPDNDLLR